MPDVYSKNISDPDFTDKKMDVSDEIEIYQQQLRNLLGGQTGRVFGATDMPVDLESYIYQLGLNERELESIIRQKVNVYIPLSKKYPTIFKVKFGKGTERDICNIDINIDGRRKSTLIIR